MTISERFGRWFLRFNGVHEELIEHEGYFCYESRKVGSSHYVWVVVPIMAVAGFTVAWLARDEPLALWLGIVFGVISGVVIPAWLWLSGREEQYSLIEIKNGILRREGKAAFRAEMEGRIDLKDCVSVEVEMDHEGETSGFRFARENGEVDVVPAAFATLVMARCRKPFVNAIRFYNPEMFEELKRLYNAKPKGWS